MTSSHFFPPFDFSGGGVSQSVSFSLPCPPISAGRTDERTGGRNFGRLAHLGSGNRQLAGRPEKFGILLKSKWGSFTQLPLLLLLIKYKTVNTKTKAKY